MSSRTIAAPAGAREATSAYVYYVLFALMAINALAYLDRSIINILSQAIKVDLNLSDTQLGLLSGIAFVLIYTVCALPIAWLAERKSRVSIITACIATWSVMTALCGQATSFVQMMLYRTGVGIGEAGASPSAHSLISDYVPAERRASAISIFVFGNPLGLFLGSVVGGYVAQHFSWRTAFLLVGVPGLLVAVLVKLTILEPERGAAENRPGHAAQPARSLLQVCKHMFGRKSFVQLVIGFTLIGIVIPGIAAFLPAFYIRKFGFNYAQAGVAVGLLAGIAGAAGTLVGGYLTDWATRHDKRWFARLPAILLLVCGPLFVLGFVMTDWRWSMAVLALPFFLKSMHFAPTLAAVHGMAEPRMRATAITILFIIANSIGSGGGPVVVGMLSDFFASRHFHGVLSASCAAPVDGGASLAHACAAASSYGVNTALILISGLYAWGSIHYFIATRHIKSDLIA